MKKHLPVIALVAFIVFAVPVLGSMASSGGLGLGLLLTAVVLWCFYSKTGGVILISVVLVGAAIAFPPLLIVGLFYMMFKWLEIQDAIHDANDIELQKYRKVYPNSYRNRFGQIIIMS